MSCFVEFKDGKRFSEEYAEKQLGKAVAFNPNINMVANKGTMEILRMNGLVDTTDKEKYGVLSTTSNQNIKARIEKAYEKKGLQGVRDLYNDGINKIEGNPSNTLGEKKIKAMRENGNVGDRAYQAIIDELGKDIEQRASEAGVTVEEMRAYDEAEDLTDELQNKIDEYKKNVFDKEARKLYNNLRRVLRLSYPLYQRGGVIIGEDGFFADVELVKEQTMGFIDKANERWDKLEESWAAKKLEKLGLEKIATGVQFAKSAGRGALKHWSRIVSMDNGLMKMGIAKGTAGYDIMYEALNRGNRDVQAQNVEGDSMVGEIRAMDKYAPITKYLSGLKGDKLHNHEIEFAGGKKVKISGAEAISLYLTFRQTEAYKRAVYDADRLAKAKRDKADIVTANVGEHEEGGKKPVVLTDDAFREIQKIVETEYAETLELTPKIMKMQHEKMDDTMFKLTGQHLPDLPDYFPTFEATSDTDAEVEARLAENLRYIKERTDGIKSYDIRDYFTLMTSYIHSTNYYANMAVPMRNARLLYHELKKDGAFDGSFEVIGAGCDKWLENLETNKGVVDFGDIDKAVNKWYSRYYKGVLGWNVPVVLKQPLSALHAWNFFGDKKYAKYVLDAYKLSFSRMKPELEELRKYNPVMAVYMDNLAAPELGRLLKTGGHGNWGTFVNSGMGGAAKQLGSAYINKSLELIRHFDLATRIGLWNASKEYVRTKYEITEAAGDVYWEQVASTFNQVNENTQQTFDLFHRSELGRSPNPFARGFLMFTTQLQKHLSLMDKAVTNYALYGRKEDRANLIRTAASVLFMQSALVAMIDLGKDALLGYDDDEDKTRKVLASTLSNSLAIIPGLNLVSSDIANGVFGEELLYSRPVSTPIVDGIQYMQETMNDAFDKDGEAIILGIWNEGSKYAGVPLAPFRQFEQYQKNKED